VAFGISAIKSALKT